MSGILLVKEHHEGIRALDIGTSKNGPALLSVEIVMLGFRNGKIHNTVRIAELEIAINW